MRRAMLAIGLLICLLGGLSSWRATPTQAQGYPGCATSTAISAPFSYSGVGELCWRTKELGAYVQSWGTDSLQINGVDYTNRYAVTDEILRDTTGTYYVYYKAGTNGNFSATGNSGIASCTARWCSSAQYGKIQMGPFMMYNNVWGASTGTGQIIQANSHSDWSTFSTTPRWTWPGRPSARWAAAPAALTSPCPSAAPTSPPTISGCPARSCSG
jgi:hypothetical protein